MATDVNTLLEEAKCYACADDKQLTLIMLALLRRNLLALDPDAMTDTDTLLEEAKCYACADGKQLTLMILALLQQIAESGGSSSVCCGLEGHGPPLHVPTYAPSFYVDVDTGVVYWYFNGVWSP